MEYAEVSIDESVFAHFVPINSLPPEQQKELVRHTRVLEVMPGQIIGDEHDWTCDAIYLLEGELAVFARGCIVDRIVGGGDAARFRLAFTPSSELSVRAETPVCLLSVDRNVMSTLLTWAQAKVEENDTTSVCDAEAHRLNKLTLDLLNPELLTRIPPANIQRIRALMKAVRVEAGEIIIRQGDPGDYYYMIRQGRCEVTRKPMQGTQSVKLAELGEGESFGEEALLSGTKRNATVSALTNGILMQLSKDNFLTLIKEPLLDDVTKERATEWVATGSAKWLDVRLAEEHDHDGINGSINIPLGEIRKRSTQLDEALAYVVYSNSGRRSSAGTFLLKERGIKAYVLKGGLIQGSGADREGVSRALMKPSDSARLPPSLKVSRLKEELTRANVALEAAIQHKGHTETARLLAEKESTAASEALTRAQRRKRTLEAALRLAESDAAGRRADAEAAYEQSHKDVKAWLSGEQEALASTYARAEQEIQSLELKRERRETELRKERERLEADFSQTIENTDEATKKIVVEEMNATRLALDQELEEIESHHAAAKRRLRTETEAKLRAERKRLEAEFADQVAQLALNRAQAVKRAAEQKAKRISTELQAVEEERRIEATLRAEQQAIEAKSARAQQQDSDTDRHQVGVKRNSPISAKKTDKPIETEERLLPTRNQQELRATLQKVTSLDKTDSEGKAEAEIAEQGEPPCAPQNLSTTLYQEAEEWLREEQARSESELERARLELERLEQAKAHVEREKKEAKTASQRLLADVGAQLEADYDPMIDELDLEPDLNELN
jgi:CRP-like cAMP-binding protein